MYAGHRLLCNRMIFIRVGFKHPYIENIRLNQEREIVNRGNKLKLVIVFLLINLNNINKLFNRRCELQNSSKRLEVYSFCLKS